MTLTLHQLDILISLLEERFDKHINYLRLHDQLCVERKKREDLIK